MTYSSESGALPIRTPRGKTAWAARMRWSQLGMGALLMLATLPGRTQGLGLITEPLLADLSLDRVTYASFNLWATLLGALMCFPAGWAIDRYGLRVSSAVLSLLLGLSVLQTSRFTGSLAVFFGLILATRAFGQSALSVCSITMVGRWYPDKTGRAMGVYSVLISLSFAVAFVAVGYFIRLQGWRDAWMEVALVILFLVTPCIGLVACEPGRQEESADASPSGTKTSAQPDLSLGQAARTGAFWLFAGAAASFNLVSSGLGLFNEAVLAEHGFDQRTYHYFLGLSTLLSLVGQMGCGWLTTRTTYQKLTVMALSLYAAGLASIPFVRTVGQLWGVAALLGISGGMIIVIFFSIWSEGFGQKHLGRIQGAAQGLTVVSSGLGPILFAKCFERQGTYTPLLLGLAGAVFALALTARFVALPGGRSRESDLR